ncbi:hypothetical protein [Simkania negevensis]|nr:hypothetical protein [Simkania negevensis]
MSLQIERADQEQFSSRNCCFNFNFRALLEKILSAIQWLFPCFGRQETGIASVSIAEEPIEVRSREFMSCSAAQKAPPSWFNRVCIENVAGKPIGLIEVITHCKKGHHTLFKSSMEPPSYPMHSATRMGEEYQLEILVSKTADCFVPLEATDPFLIEGAYRNEMAKVLQNYHTAVEPVKGVEDLCESLIRVGDYTLPETLPAPLLKELRSLEAECQQYATAESVNFFSERHRDTIRKRGDTVQILTPVIAQSGETHIKIHSDRVEVTFDGEKKIFSKNVKF